MARVVQFEVHAEDPQRAIAFYETALGWSFREVVPDTRWQIVTGGGDRPGIDGVMTRRKGPAPDPDAKLPLIGYVCTVEARSLDLYIQAIENSGGTIVVPRHPIPGTGWSAYARDTEGNIFGLHQPDPAAA